LGKSDFQRGRTRSNLPYCSPGPPGTGPAGNLFCFFFAGFPPSWPGCPPGARESGVRGSPRPFESVRPSPPGRRGPPPPPDVIVFPEFLDPIPVFAGNVHPFRGDKIGKASFFLFCFFPGKAAKKFRSRRPLRGPSRFPGKESPAPPAEKTGFFVPSC